MRISSEYLRLLAWIAGGGVAGVVLGALLAAYSSGFAAMPLFLGAIGSYLGMLVGDRRRLAARRAARGIDTSGPAARRARRAARETRRRP